MKKHRNFRQIATFVVVSVMCSLLSLAGSASDAEAAKEHVDIVALGDSFTAGNGAGSYDPNVPGCYESHASYAYEFSDLLRTAGWSTTVGVTACSGATTSNIPQQISLFNSSTRSAADIVLLTVGGNDAGFKEIVTYCLIFNIRSVCDARLNQAEALIGTIRSRTRDQLVRILNEFPNAQIVLVGYPYLLDNCHGNPIYTLEDGNYPSGARIRALSESASDMQAGLVAELNLSNAYRLSYVGVMDLFANHEVCGPLDDWINPTGFANGFPTGDTDQWWHPNARGHQAIALRLFQRRNSFGIGGGFSDPLPAIGVPSGPNVYSNLPLSCGEVSPYASTYGSIGLPGGGSYDHSNAIDLPVDKGTLVAAPATGHAVVKWDPNGYGHYVEVIDATGRMHRMAHLQAAGLLSSNRHVRQGEIIGRVGETGFTTGPHLHYEQLVGGVMKPLVLTGGSLNWGPVKPSGDRFTTHPLVSGNCGQSSTPNPYRHEEVKIHRNGSTYRINPATGQTWEMWEGIMAGQGRVECDTDGDGETELYSAEFRNNRWYVMQGTWGKSGSERGWSVFSADFDGNTINAISCGDRDGNGNDEVKVHLTGGSIRRINSQTGQTWVMFSGLAKSHFLVECDVNGDNQDEIYSAEFRNNRWYVMQGKRPNAQNGQWRQFSADFDGRGITAMTCGDRDGNGVDEVKVHLDGGGSIRRINAVNGTTWDIWNGIAPPLFAVECDANADGRDEFYSVEHRNNRWYVMQGEWYGTGDVSWSVFSEARPLQEISAMTCGDRDNW